MSDQTTPPQSESHSSPTPTTPAKPRQRYTIGVPIFALLCHFTAALWIGAAILDCLNRYNIWSHGGITSRGSHFLIQAGFCAAALFIPTAIVEILFLVSPRAKKLGWLYLATLAIAGACFAATYFLRINGKMIDERLANPAYISSLAGGILAIIASRLGTLLVYHHRLGVRRPIVMHPTLTKPAAKHPMHILFAHLPIGLWLISIFLDAWTLKSENREPWYVKTSFLCITIGATSALCAIITGFIDWLETREDHPAQRLSLFHMFFTMAATTMFIVNSGLRWTQINYLAPTPGTFVLSLIGYVTLLVGGFFGAQLVYKHNFAVKPESFDK